MPARFSLVTDDSLFDFVDLGVLAILIVFAAIALWWLWRYMRSYSSKVEQTMERQALVIAMTRDSVELERRMLDIAEKSLDASKANSELLRRIVELMESGKSA